MKKKLLTLFVLGLIVVGCNKEQSVDSLSPNSVSNMNDMVIDNGFDWKTSHVLSIQLKGLNIDTQIKKTVEFKNAHGEVILKKFVSLTDDHVFEVEYPDYMEEITMVAGGMTKTARVSNSAVSFDFSKPDDRSDLAPEDQ